MTAMTPRGKNGTMAAVFTTICRSDAPDGLRNTYIAAMTGLSIVAVKQCAKRLAKKGLIVNANADTGGRVAHFWRLAPMTANEQNDLIDKFASKLQTTASPNKRRKKPARELVLHALKTVKTEPGLTIDEIATVANVTHASAKTALLVLERHGAIIKTKINRICHFYLPERQPTQDGQDYIDFLLAKQYSTGSPKQAPKPVFYIDTLHKLLTRNAHLEGPAITAEQKLAVSVIVRAIVDALDVDYLIRASARRFLYGDALSGWALLAGLQPWFVREVAEKSGHMEEVA